MEIRSIRKQGTNRRRGPLIRETLMRFQVEEGLRKILETELF